MEDTKKYKIALVDDESLFLQGLTMLVNNNEHMQVILSAENGQDLLTQLSKHEDLPDLLLCDLEMPVTNGVDVTKAVAASYPDIKVVILSSHYEPSLILKMLEIGASAFMPKNEKPDDFYLTIINVIEKGFHYNDYIVQLIREKMLFGSKKKVKSSVELTSREMEILKLICDQKTNREIGEEIFISPRTVEGHRNRLLEKTDSKNTAGLIIYAIENGYYSVNILNKWEQKIE
jgi:Response regulator containing a CheY-like receiver domain and an HTH DNA-binding domain